MDTPVFADGQFVNAALLNEAFVSDQADFQFIGDRLHTPGLLSPSTLVFTPTNLVVQIQAPAPFAVLFGNGTLTGAHGTVDGADTTTYNLNFASFVPGSGSQTVYCLAQVASIGENLVTVVGPPPGHPDYDPTFNPFDFYNTQRDSLSITASTTAPNNTTTFELFRVVLNAGQSIITSGQINTANWHYASAVLNPTGVTAGTYTGATITVSADGRITTASSVAYGPLAGNNTWTGTNTFDLTTFFGTSGQFYLNPNNAGSQLLNFAANNYLQYTSGTGLALNSTGSVSVGGTQINLDAPVNTTSTIGSDGNITAVNGRLRATFGAKGSGDGNAAVILNDYGTESFSNPGYVVRPDGLIIQFGIQVLNGNPTIAESFPIAFPHACLTVVCTEGAANGGWGANGFQPTIHGASGFNTTQWFHGGVGWDDTSKTWHYSNLTTTWIAIGF